MGFMHKTSVLWLLLTAMTVVYGRSLLSNDIIQNRTLRHTFCNEDEYPVRGICCQHCPAGSHVYRHCTVSHQRGDCLPCTEGKDYTGFSNGLEHCIGCSKCRPDQVLAKECTVKTDAKCRCKPGYFCIPEEPCEACTRCSRCPEGQRVTDQCTATRDTVCVDVPRTVTTFSSPGVASPKKAATDSTAGVTGSQTDPDGTGERTDFGKGDRDVWDSDGADQKTDSGRGLKWIPLSIAAISVMVFILALYFAICRKEEKPGTGSETSLVSPSTIPSTDSSTQPTPVMDRTVLPEQNQEVVRLLISEESVHLETESIAQATPSHLGVSRDPDPTEDDDVEESEESDRWGNAGQEEVEICAKCDQQFTCDCQWTDFFYAINDHVPVDRFKRLARQLRLTDTAIDQIIRNNVMDSAEQNFQFLKRWRQQTGKQANMKTVLHTLQEMGLEGCCENIVNSLKSKNIYLSGPWKSS